MGLRERQQTPATPSRPYTSVPPIALSSSSSWIILTTLSFLLMGCGSWSRAISGSPTNPVSRTPKDPGTSGQTMPIPSVIQPLTGCANPNIGISNGDWGAGTIPVYTDPVSLTVGAPIYSANEIFWTSRENGPGQSILLTGAFTDATKRARLAFIPPGTADWQTLVSGSTTVISTVQQGTTGLSFLVPTNFPSGVYGFEIEDPSAPPLMGLANAPSMNWVIGVPSTTDPSMALQHHVYDCGVEPGGTLRIFGKNFAQSHQVILQSSGDIAYSLKPTAIDSNSVAVSVPSTLAPGTYNLWIGSAPWSATSSPASKITVYLPPPMNIEHFVCADLVSDGITDNSGRLQSCLDRYAPRPGSNRIAYIAVPAGSFALTAGVTAHSFEVVSGSSTARTKLLGRPRATPPVAWLTVPQYFGLTNITFQAPANPYLLLSSGTTTGNPLTSGHLFFSNVSFASTYDASNGRESMFALAGPDIQVYNSTFLSGSNQVLDIDYGDGAVVSGNRIILNNWTGLGISDSQNVVFENNLTYSENPVGRGTDGRSAGSGLGISRGNNQYGPSALSRNIYVGYNTFKNMGSGGQQVITNDGDGGAYFGPVASSSSVTVTLADDPAWNWMGTTNPQAAVMVIIAGTGLGQYSFLQDYSGRTIDLVSPWKVVPDSTSIVVISQYELNMTIAHNIIINTLGSSIVLGDALEGVIEDNTLVNSGQGILISAFGPYGGPAAYGPVMNTDVLRNTIAAGKGNFIIPSVDTNIAGIGIQDMPGCLVSGLMIRDNAVSSLNTIFSVDGLNGISANVIEQNQANWLPTWPIPGFLIQDNSPPSK